MTDEEDTFPSRMAPNVDVFIVTGEMWVVVGVRAKERKPSTPELCTRDILCIGMESFPTARCLVVDEEGVRLDNDAVPTREEPEAVVNVVIGDGKTLLIKTANVPKDISSCEHARRSDGSKITKRPVCTPVPRIIMGEASMRVSRGEVVKAENHTAVLYVTTWEKELSTDRTNRVGESDDAEHLEEPIGGKYFGVVVKEEDEGGVYLFDGAIDEIGKVEGFRGDTELLHTFML